MQCNIIRNKILLSLCARGLQLSSALMECFLFIFSRLRGRCFYARTRALERTIPWLHVDRNVRASGAVGARSSFFAFALPVAIEFFILYDILCSCQVDICFFLYIIYVRFAQPWALQRVNTFECAPPEELSYTRMQAYLKSRLVWRHVSMPHC